jgi:nucleoside 2-deoxyribosyltransferase
MKIYVASSWRNDFQPYVVACLRNIGHDVYDFKNPAEGDNGFHWSEIDPNWKEWTPEQLREAHKHPLAVAGFKKDMDALIECDICVLVMPCGRSAHLEAGYAVGAGKPTAILLADGEPELMYKMARVCTNIEEVLDFADNCCHYKTKSGFNVATQDWCTHTAIEQPASNKDAEGASL